MEYFYKFLVLSFLSTFRICFGEVHLKIILRPPMATLECTISQINSENSLHSVILMCPNEYMCFQNCVRLCPGKSCIDNPINCTYSEMGYTKKFTFIFNTLNSLNHGEWTCHYGSMKGSTVTFFNVASKTSNKREVPINITNVQVTNPIKIPIKPNIQEPSVSISTKTPHTIIAPHDNRFNISNVNPYYVVLLLVIFSFSLLINFIFLVRDMLTNISTRKALHSNNGENYSCWLALCIKLFCLKKVLNMKPNRGQIRLNENNPLISRQVSSNIYEHSQAFHMQSPFILENFAYAGTPSNERMLFPNTYIRSKSFPVKNNDTALYPSVFNTVKVAPDKNALPNHEESTSSNELTNQIIYDDVAEPSLHYNPYDSSTFYNSLARQNMRPSRHFSMQNKNPLTARSMSNLNLKSKYPSDTMIGGNAHEVNGESMLKDAINSRVELSKEMITQADSLLRQADNLLNKRDTRKNEAT